MEFGRNDQWVIVETVPLNDGLKLPRQDSSKYSL
jgi:hypothetical protein